MIFRYLLTAMFFSLPFIVQGQQKEYMLSGHVYLKGGPTCRYDVVFTITGNTLKGYSITTQPGGPALNAAIKGSMDRKNQSLTFKESKMPQGGIEGDCMFDVSLTYTLKDGQYIFSGPFTGKNSKNQKCYDGKAILEIKKDVAKIFEKEKPKKKPVQTQIAAPAVDSLIDNPVDLSEFSRITAMTRKEFIWYSDTCILEIWDGEVVDGDIVTIEFNDKKILTNYTLTAGKKRLVIPLLGVKRNTIAILAENEGKAPPNTSMIRLSDGTRQHGVLACINEGETAEIILVKK